MQGIHQFIPTELKAKYLNLLLNVGFDTLDFGSFVSPRAIPQLKDTREVLSMLDLHASRSKLLAIVANLRGAEEAVSFEEISYIGFPFSVSETFQQRNTNSSITDSLDTVERMLELCSKNDKQAVIYLSMGFGNPYGDKYSEEIVAKWAGILVEKGAKILSLSDTIGVSVPAQIESLMKTLLTSFPEVEIGIHLHSTPESRLEKLAAAYNSGCMRFDSALMGYGGCPMAVEDLTGNMATEDVISYLEAQGEILSLNKEVLTAALRLAPQLFV